MGNDTRANTTLRELWAVKRCFARATGRSSTGSARSRRPSRSSCPSTRPQLRSSLPSLHQQKNDLAKAVAVLEPLAHMSPAVALEGQHAVPESVQAGHGQLVQPMPTVYCPQS